jgi:hypothetical protein
LDKPLHVMYKVSKLAYRIWVILIANERVKKKLLTSQTTQIFRTKCVILSSNAAQHYVSHWRPIPVLHLQTETGNIVIPLWSRCAPRSLSSMFPPPPNLILVSSKCADATGFEMGIWTNHLQCSYKAITDVNSFTTLNIVACMEWAQTGFGLVIGFIEHFNAELVTTSYRLHLHIH